MWMRRAARITPAFFAALLPKCPICLMAWMSGAGIPVFAAYAAFLLAGRKGAALTLLNLRQL